MSKKTSPWVYVGCGCAVLAVGLVTVIAAFGMLGWREIRNIEATMKDPVMREQKVLEMLGAESLPAGLHAQFFLHIPFLLDLAMISDAASKSFEEGEHPFTFQQQMLTVLDIRDIGDHRARFRRRLDEEEVATDALDDVDIDLGFRGREVLSHGNLSFEGWDFVYQVVRGESDGPGRDRDGVATLGDIRCAEDDGRLRILIWFQADEARAADEGPEEVAEITATASAADEASIGAVVDSEAGSGAGSEVVNLGSPRDESDIRRLLSGFAPCGAGQSSP